MAKTREHPVARKKTDDCSNELEVLSAHHLLRITTTTKRLITQQIKESSSNQSRLFHAAKVI